MDNVTIQTELEKLAKLLEAAKKSVNDFVTDMIQNTEHILAGKGFLASNELSQLATDAGIKFLREHYTK